MIMMIIATSFLFTYVMSYLGITQAAAQWLVAMHFDKWTFFVWINVFLVILGFFLPPVAIILMVTPIILPSLKALGIDLIWFGIIMTILMEMGLIHPPVGLNLFVIQGIAPELKLRNIVWGTMPFIGTHGARHRAAVLLSRDRTLAAQSRLQGPMRWLRVAPDSHPPRISRGPSVKSPRCSATSKEASAASPDAWRQVGALRRGGRRATGAERIRVYFSDAPADPRRATGRRDQLARAVRFRGGERGLRNGRRPCVHADAAGADRAAGEAGRRVPARAQAAKRSMRTVSGASMS